MKVNASISIQFMMKNKVTDMPRMLPIVPTSIIVDLDVPDDIVQFIPVFMDAADTLGSYNPSKEFIKKWKPRVKQAYPTLFDVSAKPSDNEIVDYSISLSVDDALDEYIEKNFNEVLSNANIEIPVDTDDEYYADKFVHIHHWDAV